MKVVILSAGQGRRLLPLTESRPKCLIPLAGRSLLAWQLEALAAVGVTEAVVVTGFAAEQVEAEIARVAPAGMQVRTLHNPFYAVADNLGSCWVARHELRGDVMVLNGDSLIEPAVAERLIAAPPAPITVSIDRKPAYDADDMKVRIEGARLLAIGKTLPLEEVDGESIGFLRFSPEGARLFVEEVEAMMRSPDGLRAWYLSVVNRLAARTGAVSTVSVEGLQWGEMDFPADVAANERLARSWLEREAVDAGPLAASA